MWNATWNSRHGDPRDGLTSFWFVYGTALCSRATHRNGTLIERRQAVGISRRMDLNRTDLVHFYFKVPHVAEKSYVRINDLMSGLLFSFGIIVVVFFWSEIIFIDRPARVDCVD
jgi:hypothetical protein